MLLSLFVFLLLFLSLMTARSNLTQGTYVAKVHNFVWTNRFFKSFQLLGALRCALPMKISCTKDPVAV